MLLFPGSIYCIGGRDGTYQALNTVMRFSPDEGTWSYVSPMNQRRFGAAAQELNEKIYVMGMQLLLILLLLSKYTIPSLYARDSFRDNFAKCAVLNTR